jgi:hypothetical protein
VLTSGLYVTRMMYDRCGLSHRRQVMSSGRGGRGRHPGQGAGGGGRGDGGHEVPVKVLHLKQTIALPPYLPQDNGAAMIAQKAELLEQQAAGLASLLGMRFPMFLRCVLVAVGRSHQNLCTYSLSARGCCPAHDPVPLATSQPRAPRCPSADLPGLVPEVPHQARRGHARGGRRSGGERRHLGRRVGYPRRAAGAPAVPARVCGGRVEQGGAGQWRPGPRGGLREDGG